MVVSDNDIIYSRLDAQEFWVSLRIKQLDIK
jgi:hypothetical protein